MSRPVEPSNTRTTPLVTVPRWRISPDGDLTTYGWDPEGRLLRMTDPEGGEYRFGYDGAGRRVGTSYPNGIR